MEQILIERQDDTCIIYNKDWNFKLGERSISELVHIITDVQNLKVNTTHIYEIGNDKLREIGLNAHPMKKPIPPFSLRKK